MEEKINIGKLDINRYKKFFNVITDKVIITFERI